MKQENSNEFFREYGNFIYVFEHICHDMRIAIREYCFPEISLTNYNICEILLSGLTADPLKDKLLSVFIEKFNDRKIERELLSHLLKNFSTLISIRNNLVHGFSLMGWHNSVGELELDKFFVQHSKLNRHGLDKNFKVHNLATIQNINKNAKLLEGCFSSFSFLCNPRKDQEIKEQIIETIKFRLSDIKIEFEPILKSIQEHKPS